MGVGCCWEYWTGIPGDRIADLTGNSAYQANRPDGAEGLTDFELPPGAAVPARAIIMVSACAAI